MLLFAAPLALAIGLAVLSGKKEPEPLPPNVDFIAKKIGDKKKIEKPEKVIDTSPVLDDNETVEISSTITETDEEKET